VSTSMSSTIVAELNKVEPDSPRCTVPSSLLKTTGRIRPVSLPEADTYAAWAGLTLPRRACARRSRLLATGGACAEFCTACSVPRSMPGTVGVRLSNRFDSGGKPLAESAVTSSIKQSYLRWRSPRLEHVQNSAQASFRAAFDDR
jgi:hypothetical protein